MAAPSQTLRVSMQIEILMATTVPTSDELPRAKSAMRIRLRKFDEWLERAGERLNPILVKECRQSLKGKQFSITFAGVLLCCWIWSILGVMLLMGPSARFGATSVGMDMFGWYFVILAFPLLVIVPFGAFRSLADERDDRTFDLLAVSTLSPRQIVAGKLGSAAVQLLVYLSAVSPCLAFTYLLRGIEAPTILLALGYTALASLGLSVLAILAGTLASERAWQAVWSVVIIIGLLAAFLLAVIFVFNVVPRQRLGFDNREFWFWNVALLIAYASYFALFFLAAAARLTFVSENRSTPLRIVMFMQPILLIFCIVWGTVHFTDERQVGELNERFISASVVYFSILAMHWYVMGTLMSGESSRLSNRAKRHLPQSFLGRAFLTWFNPGPGTGYLFAAFQFAGSIVDRFCGRCLPGTLSTADHGNGSHRQRHIRIGQGVCSYLRIRCTLFGFGPAPDWPAAAIYDGGHRAGRIAASDVGAAWMPGAAVD